jgi:hypothetical protein
MSSGTVKKMHDTGLYRSLGEGGCDRVQEALMTIDDGEHDIHDTAIAATYADIAELSAKRPHEALQAGFSHHRS